MKLTYKNYICKEIEGRFDLWELKTLTAPETTTNLKKGQVYQKEFIIGYAFKFENLLQRIVELEIKSRCSTLTLKEYIIRYKEILNEITNILKP